MQLAFRKPARRTLDRCPERHWGAGVFTPNVPERRISPYRKSPILAAVAAPLQMVLRRNTALQRLQRLRRPDGFSLM